MRLSRMLLVWMMLPAWCLAAEEPHGDPALAVRGAGLGGEDGTGSGGRAGEERGPRPSHLADP